MHSNLASQSFFTEVIPYHSNFISPRRFLAEHRPYIPQQEADRVDFQNFKQIVRSIREFDPEIPMQSECGRANFIQSAHRAPSPHPHLQIRQRRPDVPA